MQRARSLILGLGALLLLASPHAMAQTQPQEPMKSPDFSQQQIEAFADAATEVQRVQTDLDSKAKAAQNPEEVTQLQQKAQQEASQAVEDSGLSVDEYAAIAKAANEDPDLYAMIVGLMQKRSMQ
jgi:predicted ATPase with chaperone activity